MGRTWPVATRHALVHTRSAAHCARHPCPSPTLAPAYATGGTRRRSLTALAWCACTRATPLGPQPAKRTQATAGSCLLWPTCSQAAAAAVAGGHARVQTHARARDGRRRQRPLSPAPLAACSASRSRAQSPAPLPRSSPCCTSAQTGASGALWAAAVHRPSPAAVQVCKCRGGQAMKPPGTKVTRGCEPLKTNSLHCSQQRAAAESTGLLPLHAAPRNTLAPSRLRRQSAHAPLRSGRSIAIWRWRCCPGGRGALLMVARGTRPATLGAGAPSSSCASSVSAAAASLHPPRHKPACDELDACCGAQAAAHLVGVASLGPPVPGCHPSRLYTLALLPLLSACLNTARCHCWPPLGGLGPLAGCFG